MIQKHSTIYQAASVADILSILKTINTVSIFGGATEIVRRQSDKYLNLPQHILPISHIAELQSINKTERFIEFGSCVNLETIRQLGNKKIPDILYKAIYGIANPGIRNLATIGGNISAKGMRLSCFAPLLALDTKLEIKSTEDTLWIPMSRYFSNKANEKSKLEFISKLRIPTESWDISEYTRLGEPSIITEDSASFAFLVRSQKNILDDIRIAYAGKFFFRNRDFENLLIGRILPIQEKDITGILDRVEQFFDLDLFSSNYHKKVFFNLLEKSLGMLT